MHIKEEGAGRVEKIIIICIIIAINGRTNGYANYGDSNQYFAERRNKYHSVNKGSLLHSCLLGKEDWMEKKLIPCNKFIS